MNRQKKHLLLGTLAWLAAVAALALSFDHSDCAPAAQSATETATTPATAAETAAATETTEAAATATAATFAAPPEYLALADPLPVPEIDPTTALEFQPFEDFQLRPFAVASESAHHQWTAEDGLDPAVIRRLAHNPLEEERLLRENAYLARRQLVYRKSSTKAEVQAMLAASQPTNPADSKDFDQPRTPLATTRIPLFDGTEAEVELLEFDASRADEDTYQMSGRLAGEPDSHVFFAYVEGAEMILVLSENTRIEIEPREPGEVVVKEIDPVRYAEATAGLSCGQLGHDHSSH